jgi:hypothetical protein
LADFSARRHSSVESILHPASIPKVGDLAQSFLAEAVSLGRLSSWPVEAHRLPHFDKAGVVL